MEDWVWPVWRIEVSSRGAGCLKERFILSYGAIVTNDESMMQWIHSPMRLLLDSFILSVMYAVCYLSSEHVVIEVCDVYS